MSRITSLSAILSNRLIEHHVRGAIPAGRFQAVANIPLRGRLRGCFPKAIEIAQRQEGKSLELRAATSLARLWQVQDRQTDARNLLSDIYNWFTEGFDTKDLQEAKGLLDELASDRNGES